MVVLGTETRSRVWRMCQWQPLEDGYVVIVDFIIIFGVLD
jgi:hypothetical protein